MIDVAIATAPVEKEEEQEQEQWDILLLLPGACELRSLGRRREPPAERLQEFDRSIAFVLAPICGREEKEGRRKMKRNATQKKRNNVRS